MEPVVSLAQILIRDVADLDNFNFCKGLKAIAQEVRATFEHRRAYRL